MIMAMKNIKSGFTIVELIIVIAVIGLLATLTLNLINNAQAKARDSERKSESKLVQQKLEIFFTENDYYPHHDDLGISVLSDLYGGSLSDPYGNFINTTYSDYTYTGLSCSLSECQDFEYQIYMEQTADLVLNGRQ